MGNSSTKEARPGSRNEGLAQTSDNASSVSNSAGGRPTLQGTRIRSSRHDASFLGMGGNLGTPGSDQRRETKQERDTRRAKKEQNARLKERERSLREEGVDGGYLVTLGIYTGPEDFSKTTVRSLMIERRLAPFWRGLNDHSDSWTEYQLVAAASGLPIPAPDEIPSEMSSPSSPNANSGFTKPIPIQPGSSSRPTEHLSPPAFANGASSAPSSSSPLFRGRSKTLASLTSKNTSQADLTPQEIRLPHEPQINGQPIEANLYKDVMECPICFLYYPPHLNRTRCCDQPICSECFVQIKRPDPHAPEHLDPNSPVPEDIRKLEEEGQLVSEPACCPFCVQSEFGVTYEPPPLRRGLAYASMPFSKTPESYSSSPNPHSNGNGILLAPGRKRGQSVSAAAPGVITTDKVRPDWATKLSDARSQASRRSAAASALHHAAYHDFGAQARLGFGRRRRLGEGGYRGNDGISLANMELLMAALGDPGSSRGRRGEGEEQPPSGLSSRSGRTDDIEEMMMMEAIRQSIAAEEDRKRKEDKESAKQTKKDEKQKTKQQKVADKAAKKSGLYSGSSNSSSMLSTSVSSNGRPTSPDDARGTEEGKGKARATASEGLSNAAFLGFNPLSDPSSTLNTETSNQRATHSPQQYREQSRSVLDPSLHLRHSSGASSSGSSFDGSGANSFQEPQADGSTGNTPTDANFNFGSLASMIDSELENPTPAANPHNDTQTSAKAQSDDSIEARTPTQENATKLPVVVEGRYEHKSYGDLSILDGNVANGQITQ